MVQQVNAEPARALVILNPVAGHSAPETVRSVLQATLGVHGWLYGIYETHGKDRFDRLVQLAKQMECRLVVAAGGDGTVSLVANSLAGSDIPLGILPIGTANVLALELGIPGDLEQAAELWVGEHRVCALDMMRVGERNFILQIGIGLDSLMIKDTDRRAKRLLGRFAYIATLLGKLVGYQSQRFTIVVDGQRMRPRAWQVLVANAGTLGMPPFKWGPNISPVDHKLDLCVVNVRTVGDYLRLLRQLLTGRQSGSNVTYRRIHRQAIITTDRPLPVQADGEIIGETPIHIDVVPGSIQIIVPTVAQPVSVVTVAHEAQHERRRTDTVNVEACRADQRGA